MHAIYHPGASELFTDADRYIVHQVSQVHTRMMCEYLGIDMDKVPLTFPFLGNVGPASIPITLSMEAESLNEGDKVLLLYPSGNRDESVIDNPDQFRIDRKNARHHLAFGFGVHRCMGNRLAEMQLRTVWEEIDRRFQFVELVQTSYDCSLSFRCPIMHVKFRSENDI